MIIFSARGNAIEVPTGSIMGILNATPDSFSDGGQLTLDNAVSKAQAMIESGAKILDVGGESTRPGHASIHADEESSRVVPIISALRAAFPDVLISIDSQKAEVAVKAVRAGADFVNAVSQDLPLLDVVAEAGCSVVVMRNKSVGRAHPLDDCKRQIDDLVQQAQSAGIRRNKIIADPGLGFGSLPGADLELNLALLDGLQDFTTLPCLVGASRKRFVGAYCRLHGLDIDTGSAEIAVRAIRTGAAIVRVHDVQQTAATLDAPYFRR